MVLMKYFCFYFPIRLGVIITSVISSVETGVFLIYCIMNDVDHFTALIKGIQENIEDYSSNYVFDKFLEVADSRKNIWLNIQQIIIFFTDTKEFRLIALGFSGGFIIACILNIIAALKIWRWLTLPYILMDFVRLSGLFACHVMLMMIFKKKINLGILIAASSIGGFFILFLCYMWGCSIAFYQMVGVVNSKEYQKLVSLGSPMMEKKLKNMTISTVASSIKPMKGDLPDYKHAVAGIFASDFSGFNRKHQNFRM